jgi:glycosyltransferase involved in cell wall biosynthesis
MRVAFVVQRYGLEVSGGAELLCRQVVERLAAVHEIEVLTTCAQDYVTWENEYPAGTDVVNGIGVRRFAVRRTREAGFRERSSWLHTHPHTLEQEMDWVRAQGPQVPGLLQFLVDRHTAYDAFVFFTYIYYPTVLGLPLVSDRALLVPTAHDEPALYLDMYKGLFHSPRAVLYNSVEERELLQTLFGIGHIPHAVVGVGIDVPRTVDGTAFRSKYGLSRPYVVYVGRVSASKGCPTLIEHFVRYKRARPGPLALVLIGRSEVPIPRHPDILAAGFVSDEEKFSAIAGAELFVLPSRLESLSIAFLESLAMRTPVVCDGASPVLRGHCVRSDAALYYMNYPVFEASLDLLLGDERLRSLLGRRGQAYVAQYYAWERVLEQYVRLLNWVVDNPWR